jgi:hypothetical protein
MPARTGLPAFGSRSESGVTRKGAAAAGGAEAPTTRRRPVSAPRPAGLALVALAIGPGDQVRRARHIMTDVVDQHVSKAEPFEYLRAELQVLNSILGELIPVFWKTLIDQWEQEGRPGISPADRRYPLDELSKMATEWLQTRNTPHGPALDRARAGASTPTQKARPTWV